MKYLKRFIIWLVDRIDKYIFRHRWEWLCDWLIEQEFLRDRPQKQRYRPAQTFEELEALLDDDGDS